MKKNDDNSTNFIRRKIANEILLIDRYNVIKKKGDAYELHLPTNDAISEGISAV